MKTICSPKRRFEFELHGTESQKASIFDTAMKAFHDNTTVEFYHRKEP
jgi:hypothetical protein